MGEVFKYFEPQPYLAGLVTGNGKSLKHRWHRVLVIENGALKYLTIVKMKM